MGELIEIDRALSGTRLQARSRAEEKTPPAQRTFAFASANEDGEARERALAADVSWVVEAPAGSGKTGLLIQRYLKLLGSADVVAPGQVMALTFTRAATEEIRARVMEELRAAEQGLPVRSAFAAIARSLAEAALARDRALGWGLLHDPQQLRVQSIDSLCAEIARLLPVTSGGGSGQRATEDPQPLLHEAARRTLLLLGGEDRLLSAALETVLLHREGDLAGCEALIAEMLANRDQWGGLLPLGARRMTDKVLEETVRPRLDKALEAAVCAGLQEVSAALPVARLEELAEVAADLSTRPGHAGIESPVACCREMGGPPRAIAEHLGQWRALAGLLLTQEGQWRKRRGMNSNHLRFSPLPSDKVRLAELIERLELHEGAREALCQVRRLPPARYPPEQWVVASALFRVLERALVELKFVFAERGECDFVEPALLARTALAQDDGGRAYNVARGLELRHLLVDEMQDTSTGQYELLERLTQGWAGEGKTVFLVGDPKQSIYLFRQARVERFVRLMRERRLGDLPLGGLQLSANFRSQGALVSALNGSFAQIFPSADQRDDQITYYPAQAIRDTSREAPSGALWHIGVVAGEKKQRPALRREITVRHAESLRRILADWRRRPLPPGVSHPRSIAVLVATRRELKPVVAALRRDDGDGPISFRAVNVEPLAEQPEILDLLALTRALSHPADRVAWWALLRAPWCGLSLGDLLELAGADDISFSQRSVVELLRERGHRLSGEGQARLHAVEEVLTSASAKMGRVAPAELVERTWRGLGGPGYLGAPARRNAEQFFVLLDALELRDGTISLTALERGMSRLYAAAELAEDAVELTTIHGAKGLEWDVVLIPELDRRAPPTRSRLLEWEEIPGDSDTAAAHVVLAPIKSQSEESGALHRWLNGLRSQRLAAERRRQLYVACTRAREELHLFGAADLNRQGELHPPSMSLLQAAWPAAQAMVSPGQEDDGRAAATAARTLSRATDVALAAASDAGEWETDELAGGRPISFDATARLPLHTMRTLAAARGDVFETSERTGARPFTRPEGSFRARTLGNAVHALLERVAGRLAEGTAAEEIVAALPQWRGRIHTLLRAGGLGPAEIAPLAAEVETALRQTLESPIGRWLLGARADAASEYALTSAHSGSAQVRLDRLFRAGAAPGQEGDSHLWIVDYKTGSHATAGREEWLRGERERYLGQMNAYAAVFPGERINLALWYPMIARLIWWPAEGRPAEGGTSPEIC